VLLDDWGRPANSSSRRINNNNSRLGRGWGRHKRRRISDGDRCEGVDYSGDNGKSVSGNENPQYRDNDACFQNETKETANRREWSESRSQIGSERLAKIIAPPEKSRVGPLHVIRMGSLLGPLHVMQVSEPLRKMHASVVGSVLIRADLHQSAPCLTLQSMLPKPSLAAAVATREIDVKRFAAA
jgi:hypothetical protein